MLFVSQLLAHRVAASAGSTASAGLTSSSMRRSPSPLSMRRSPSPHNAPKPTQHAEPAQSGSWGLVPAELLPASTDWLMRMRGLIPRAPSPDVPSPPPLHDDDAHAAAEAEAAPLDDELARLSMPSSSPPAGKQRMSDEVVPADATLDLRRGASLNEPASMRIGELPERSITPRPEPSFDAYVDASYVDAYAVHGGATHATARASQRGKLLPSYRRSTASHRTHRCSNGVPDFSKTGCKSPTFDEHGFGSRHAFDEQKLHTQEHLLWLQVVAESPKPSPRKRSAGQDDKPEGALGSYRLQGSAIDDYAAHLPIVPLVKDDAPPAAAPTTDALLPPDDGSAAPPSPSSDEPPPPPAFEVARVRPLPPIVGSAAAAGLPPQPLRQERYYVDVDADMPPSDEDAPDHGRQSAQPRLMTERERAAELARLRQQRRNRVAWASLGGGPTMTAGERKTVRERLWTRPQRAQARVYY